MYISLSLYTYIYIYIYKPTNKQTPTHICHTSACVRNVCDVLQINIELLVETITASAPLLLDNNIM